MPPLAGARPWRGSTEACSRIPQVRLPATVILVRSGGRNPALRDHDRVAGDPDVTPPAATPPAGDADAAPEPAYRNVEAFVGDYLAHVVERRLATGPTSGVNWCPRWWAHPEAISRLYALWRAWEMLRVSDPQTGMSIWWRDHLDPHLAALAAEYGPFSRCSPDKRGTSNSNRTSSASVARTAATRWHQGPHRRHETPVLQRQRLRSHRPGVCRRDGHCPFHFALNGSITGVLALRNNS
ncbi:DUF4913 domain-containing protein [Micromonospora sp. NPDC023633]|uniref:DUF4913 domain-containing protein n=1 Tax=Micromonospora sp. NPDC023633 TaxID=3154320 RepID=UPI003401FCF1